MPLLTPHRTFHFIRHGVTAANQQGLWCGGDWDIELHSDGREQASGLADTIAELSPKIDRIFCSPMRRARETMELLNAKAQKPFEFVEELREWRVGSLEKTPWAKHALGPKITDWSNPPGGETVAQFQDRVRRAFTYCLSNSTTPLVVAHGAVGRMLIDLLGIPERSIHNCSIYRIFSSGSEGQVRWEIE